MGLGKAFAAWPSLQLSRSTLGGRKPPFPVLPALLFPEITSVPTKVAVSQERPLKGFHFTADSW